MPLWLALCGDDSDDVPGIPGVGPKNAAKVIAQCGNLAGIKQALATVEEGEKPSAVWVAIGKNYDVLERALKLVELRVDVPIDANALLARKERQTITRPNALRSEDGVPDAEWDPISRAPEGYVAPVMAKPAPAPEAKTEAPKVASATPAPPRATATSAAATATPASSADTAGAKPSASSGTALAKYGVTNEHLEPLDLVAARNLATWIYDGQLYPQFKNEGAVLTIILRSRDLGIKITSALGGFFMVDGKPTASADMIRALSERDPNCEYLMCIYSDDKRAVWETRNRKWPAGKTDTYEYTVERAQQAGMFTGKNAHNWKTKTKEMLEKTAGSKGCRRWYPGAVGGIYCPEEMDE